MTAFQIRRKLFSFIAIILALTAYTSAPFAAEQNVRAPAPEPKETEEAEPPAVEIKVEELAPEQAPKADVQITEEDAAEVIQAVEADEEGNPFNAAAEGSGPYHTPVDGSLGLDLWNATQRPVAVKLMRAMPVETHSPSMQRLIAGTLYSKVDVGLMKGSDPIPPGDDLLTLRLNKMIEAGAYRQALDIYSGLTLGNPPQSVARAGVLSMLFSGEKSLACLELNTVKAEFGSVDFFKTVDAYCDVSLSANPSAASLDVLKASPDKLLFSLATQKDFSVTYTPAFFDKYTQLEKAALAGENRIVLTPQADRNFKDVPPTHLQILMRNSALTPKEKFILNVRSLEAGLMRGDDYKKSILASIDIDERKDPALAAPADAADWERLPYFLQIAMNKKTDEEKWANIKAALPIGRTYGLSSLVPFADVIAKVRPQAPTFEEINTSMRVLSKAGTPIPDQWAQIIENYTPAAGQQDDYAELLAAVYLSDSDNKNDKNRKKLAGLLAHTKDPHMFFVKDIIENVDNAGSKPHTPLAIYDNELDLTFRQDYVMPSMGVWNRLTEASKEGQIGETVLLSAAAVRETDLRDIHPDLFKDITASLKSVGLTDIARAMEIEAVLGKSKDD